MDDIIEAAVTSALLSMTRDNLRADQMEVLCHGDGRGTIAPKVLHRAMAAAIAAIMPAIGERMAREVESVPCDHWKRCTCTQCELNQAGDDLRALANTMAAEVGK